MYNSITFRLLFLITFSFILSAVCVVIMADRQLLHILSASQLAVYNEKIETIKGTLQRSNERLKKTGMVEAYFEDFRDSTIKGIRNTYYDGKDQQVYPFIIEREGMIFMHPVYQNGDFAPSEIMDGIAGLGQPDGSGSFEYVWKGIDKWCVYQSLPEWNMVVGYIVPIKIKYSDASSFRTKLVYIMGTVTALSLLFLSFIISRFNRPITRLTAAARAMADGNHEQMVEVNRNDEMGTLAKSFNDMRDAIRQKITELQQENSERQEAQHALANEKERLAVTLRSIGDGVITTDISGNITMINKVAEDLTGWTNREAFSRPLTDVFQIYNEHTGKPCDNPAGEVINSGNIIGLKANTVLLSKGGARRAIADSGAPIRDADSRIIGMVLVFRDVTEQIKTEKELLKIRRIESIGVLAGGIAHDFNNILSAILGNIDLALLNEQLPEKTKNLLGEAEKASIRARDLTRQLLTFSKGGDPVRETATLDDIIRDSASFVLHGDKVACNFEIPPDLWLVNIDRGQISQVIQNLVLNARQAMSEGGSIKIKCQNTTAAEAAINHYVHENKFVSISVEDNGSGIASDELEKIFDPYFSTKEKGSGLGLAICQSIINKHRGYLGVVSTPDQGTIFTIYLPVSKGSDINRQENNIQTGGKAQKAKILVLDDEKMVRDVIKALLQVSGHDVFLTVDGQETIEQFRQARDKGEPFDLLIMDLTIPGGMGGKEGAQEVLKIDPDAKIIVSSGYSNDPTIANFRQYGFCDAVIKPFKRKDLEVAVSRIMQQVN